MGLNAVQIFSRNPRSWKSTPIKGDEVEGFIQGIKEYSIWPVVVHCNYLVNLSSPEDKNYQRSLEVLQDDLRRCHLLGAHYYVLHPGNHRGHGLEYAILRITEAINRVETYEVKILVENTAGAGTEVGSTFSELGSIIDGIDREIGVCLDTAHAFVAGYDLRTVSALDETLCVFHETIGLERLLLIHANDAHGELASHKDHHQHIGEGTIGEEGFRALVNHKDIMEVPFILETPQKKNGDVKKNRSRLLSLRSHEGRLYEH